ncbi:MAG: GAF domain-containing protein [Spirochaetes bacterium]|nr:GAF domain-containing protein [Spirochaetota bacterium]
MSDIPKKEMEYLDSNNKLKLISNLYKVTSSTLNLNQLLYLIMDMTLTNLNAEVGNIILKDNEEKLYSKVVLGLSLNIINELEYNNKKLINYIFETKKPLLIKDYSKKFNSPEKLNIKSILCSPLKTKKRIIGIIFLINKNIDNKMSNFDQNDLDILNIIVNNIAFSIENAQLYEEVLNIKNFNTNIINSISTGVLTTDLYGDILSINDSAEFIFDLNQKTKYVNKNISTIIQNLNNKEVIIEALKRKENLLNLESKLRLKDGTEKILNISISVLNDMHREIIGFVLSTDDITEKKMLERQVLRNEQLAALGELSAGIAHEIKNPLTSIKGFAQILPKKLDDKKFLIKFSSIVKTEAERLNKFIDDLLQFSKPKSKKWKNHSVTGIINTVIDLMRFQLKENNIKVKKDLYAMPDVYCDPGQLKQVFINIILNSLQALAENGTMEFRTRLLIRKSPENLYYEYIAIYIIDNGKGIPKAIQNKLFNPFFTTKSEGTGLGLSITYRIISEHKGFIELFSKINEGTTFIIYLPTVNNWKK